MDCPKPKRVTTVYGEADERQALPLSALGAWFSQPSGAIGQNQQSAERTWEPATHPRSVSHQCSDIHAKGFRGQLVTSTVVAKYWELPKCPPVGTREMAAARPNNGVLCSRNGERGRALGSDWKIVPTHNAELKHDADEFVVCCHQRNKSGKRYTLVSALRQPGRIRQGLTLAVCVCTRVCAHEPGKKRRGWGEGEGGRG